MAVRKSAPRPKTPDEALIEAFVKGAEAQPAQTETPWTSAGSEYVTLNTRIPHRLSVQLHWLMDRKSVTKREAVEEAVTAWVDAELSKLGISRE